MTEFEESIHYADSPQGPAVVRFYEAEHKYLVTDPAMNLVEATLGGATSITGLLSKGKGLEMFPLWEMSKYLKKYFENTTVQQLIDSPDRLSDILKEGRDASERKSDLGKSVGTDAHAWVEAYLKAHQEWEKDTEQKFVPPAIPTVRTCSEELFDRYIAVIQKLKPDTVEDYQKLPNLLRKDFDYYGSVWTEASMIVKSITAAKNFFDRHDIIVHGCEDTIYSRIYGVCGKYDSDLSVHCTIRCGWCYRNGDQSQQEADLWGRYITDFKSTNSNESAPKGIYDNYLIQCGVYDMAKTEEFPNLNEEIDGHLILNGSKQNGTFNTHFSFDRDRNNRMARTLCGLRTDMWSAKQEIKYSA